VSHSLCDNRRVDELHPYDRDEFERQLSMERAVVMRRYERWRDLHDETQAHEWLASDEAYHLNEVLKFRDYAVRQPEFADAMQMFHDVALANLMAVREVQAVLAAADVLGSLQHAREAQHHRSSSRATLPIPPA
jgi:hypothetical protein